MDKTSILGQALGQVGDLAKKTGENLVKVPKDLAEAAAEQAGAKQQVTSNNKQLTSDDKTTTQDVVKSLYSKSGNTNQPVNNQPQQQPQSDFQKEIANKSPEEQKELMGLRKKLHDESYYDPTFNPVKKQEERPAEKVENEKKKEEMELQKKEEKKPPPLAVQRARNKAEMFPGASG